MTRSTERTSLAHVRQAIRCAFGTRRGDGFQHYTTRLYAARIYASADANAKQATAATIDEVMERRLSPQEVGSFT